MKRFFTLILLASLLSLCGMASLDSAPSPSTSGKKEVPIIIRKGNREKPSRFSPSKGVQGIIYVEENQILFSFPIELSPVVCEVEQLSPQYGYWTSTFDDAESCEMYFDGTCGDYKLTLSDGETTYIGYFSL